MMMRQYWIRYRMPLAALLIAVLLAYLAVREGLSCWRAREQWQALAATAAQLQRGPALTLERLHGSAQARQVTISEVEPQGQAWSVRGQVATAEQLEQWLQALQGEGARPVQWGLEQHAGTLRFELLVQP